MCVKKRDRDLGITSSLLMGRLVLTKDDMSGKT